MSDQEDADELLGGLLVPAEYVGQAGLDDGHLVIGSGENVVRVGPFPPDAIWVGRVGLDCYVRRWSDDLTIAQIHIGHGNQTAGLAQEELDEQNRQAGMYPLGPKEYWRGEMVGKYTTRGGDPDAPERVMTDEDFEADWED